MAERAQLPRKKSCSACSKAKVRCDLERPLCTRCRNRGLACIYTEANAIDENLRSTRAQDRSVGGVGNIYTGQTAIDALSNDGNAPAELNFDHIKLFTAVDEHKVRARWLESLLPSVEQRQKPYTAPTMKFVSRVFNSYPAMFAEEGSSPPFIHWTQMKVLRSQLLIECANTCHTWCEWNLGNQGTVTTMSIEAQMDRIYHKVRCPQF